MAGRRSRNKGARGEREIMAILQPIVDKVCDTCGHPKFVLRRNADQRFAAKQYDIIGIPWIALEVKRVEQLSVGRWWKQTLAATRDGQTPVLAYRKNHQPWTFKLRVPVRCGTKHLMLTTEMAEREFLFWFEHLLRHQLE